MNDIVTLIEAIFLIYAGFYGLRFKDGKLELSPEKKALREQRLKTKNMHTILSVLSVFCIFGGVILFLVSIWSIILDLLAKA